MSTTRHRAPPLDVRPLLPTDWPALEDLFGPNGACGGCWCMYWRAHTMAEFDALKGAPAKQAFRALVESGQARGVVAFEGDRAVGWCAFGPRADFPLTETKRSYVIEDAPAVWSVNCFFVRAGYRRRGIARLLLDAAVDEARAAGARTLEGYPAPVVPPNRPSFKGALSTFEDAGFRIVQRLYRSSPLVRRTLRPGS